MAPGGWSSTWVQSTHLERGSQREVTEDMAPEVGHWWLRRMRGPRTALTQGWGPGCGGARQLLPGAGASGLCLGLSSSCGWGQSAFHAPFSSSLPSSPSSRRQYQVLCTGLLCSCLSADHGEKSQGAPVGLGPAMGALHLSGEGTEAGRHEAGLSQGQAGPVNPILLAQPFGPFSPPCCSTLGRKNLSEWPFN